MTLATVLDHEERRRPLTGIQPQNRPEATQPTGPTILVVDDEPFIRNVLKLLLESNGFRVMQAGDGNEALELYQINHTRIELVLLDVPCPDRVGRRRLPTCSRCSPTCVAAS